MDPAPEPPRRPRRRGGALTAFVCLAAVAAIVGWGAPWLPWWAELPAHFPLQQGVVLAGVALVLVLLRRPGWAVGAGALALAHLALVAPDWLRSRPAPPAGPTVRVLCANVHTANDDHQALVRLVRAERPDVILLLEVDQAWMDGLRDLRSDFAPVAVELRDDNFGIAVLARTGVVPAAAVHLLGEAEVPAVEATVRVGGRDLHLLVAHALPPISGWYAAERGNAFARLAALCAPHRDVALVGDLNCSPYAPAFRRLLTAGGLRDSRAGFGRQASWPVSPAILRIPIDHCLVGAGVAVAQRRLGAPIGSDHLPVVVDLGLRD